LITWSQQGGATVGAVTLPGGRTGKVVVVGPRELPKGAMIVYPDQATGTVQKAELDVFVEHLPPWELLEVYCMQERIFGSSGLNPPGLA
jgi:hypothetical protein